METFDLNKLKRLSIEYLREEKTQQMIGDLVILLKNGLDVDIWNEDVMNDPKAYSYTPDELEHFLYQVSSLHEN